jgi:hypothetical protein
MAKKTQQDTQVGVQAMNAQRNTGSHAVAPVHKDESFRARRNVLDDHARRSDAELHYAELRNRVIELVRLATPRGSKVLIITKGDDEMLEAPGRQCWHFPRAVNGLYAGCYPADSREAIAHLRTLQSQGAQYLCVPSTSYWWLEFYERWTAYLQRCHRLAAYQEDVGVLYRLLQSSKRRSGRMDAQKSLPAQS